MDLLVLKQSVMDGLEWALTPSAPVFILAISIVLLVPVLLHFYLARSVQYIVLPSILVVGPAGAGKTALLSLLERRTASQPAATRTSQVPNVVELAVTEERSSSWRQDLDAAGATAVKFLLVDTPGHGKLRVPTLTRLTGPAAAANKVKAVVFLVDAGALADHDALASAAVFLYDVLLSLQQRMGATRTSKAPDAIPVLIACNKADLFTALPAPLVRAQLEAELGRIRQSRRKGLLDSSIAADDDAALAAAADAPEGDEWLGQYGSGAFVFDQMREFDIDVDVISGNVVGDGPGVDKWWSWMVKKI